MVRHHAYSAPLVQHIQFKLKAEHTKLLSYDVLTMIFNYESLNVNLRLIFLAWVSKQLFDA
jgi:hypothetical protein